MSKRLIFISVVLLVLCTVGYGDTWEVMPVSSLPIPPGFVTAADTGLAGVGLTIADLDVYTGPVTISVSGTVIENKYIPNGLEFEASNITVRKCFIGAKGCYAIDNAAGGSGHIIEDCTMVGQPCQKRLGAAMRIGGYTIRRCDISRYHDGAKFGDGVVVEDTYIHHLMREDGADYSTHNDCLQTAHTNFARLSHNTLQAPYKYTNSAIFFVAASGDNENVTIEDNFLSGGGYTMYFGAKFKNGRQNYVYNSVIRNNVWEKDAWSKGPMAGTGSPGAPKICNRYHTGELCEFSQPCGGNQQPTANAGPDQVVNDADDSGSESVTLDGTSSYDTDGSISSYVWEENSTQIATGSGPSVTLTVGTHLITLIVTDNNDAIHSDNVTIEVTAAGFDSPPIADAGANQSVTDTDGNGSQSVNLDGTGSTDDFGIASYVWKEGTTVIATGATPSVTLDVGGHTITLEVLDANDNSDTDTVGITVVSPGALTSDTSWQSQALSSSQTGTFTVEFDAVPNTSGMSGVTGFSQSVPAAHSDVACIVRFSSAGEIDVRNGGSYAAVNTVNYSVGTNYHFVFDIDITNHLYDVYVTPAGGSQTTLATDYAFRTDQASATSLAYIGVTAGTGTHTVDNVTIVVGGPNNVAPTAAAGSDQSVDADVSGSALISLDGSSSSDSDGTISSYVWSEDSIQIATGAEPNVTLDADIHTIVLTVTDNDGAQGTDTVVITVNALPVASAGADQTLTDSDGDGSEIVVLDGSGSSDIDGTISSYSWKEGAVEIATTVNPNLSMTVGVHTIDLTVTDNDSATGTDQVVITVNAAAANIPPVADAGPDQIVTDANGSGDEVVTLDGTGSSDSDGTISTYVWKEGTTQIATGSGPNATLAVGEHTITLTVTDDDSDTDTDNVVVTVYPYGSLTSSTTWQSNSYTSQNGTFTANFDVIPHNGGLNAVTGLCNGSATAHSDLACIVRLNTSGQIDVRDGDIYSANSVFNYSVGNTYHVRMEVDISSKTYDVFVTNGGSEVQIADDYGFRTEQSSVAALDNLAVYSSSGTHTTLNLSVTTVADTTAPSPSPMTFATAPYSTGTSSIAMIATTATDISGVEYSFDCTAGVGGTDSGWQDSPTYTDIGLNDSTSYTYKVQARDKSANQNATTWSTTASATTDDGTAPTPDPMTWSSVPAADSNTAISMTATTATDSSGVEYYFDWTAGSGGSDSGWQDSASYTDSGLLGDTQYTYMVRARDKSTAQNATGWSATASATTNADTGGGGGEDVDFYASDDTYVKSSSSGANFGSITTIKIRAGTTYYGYLKFTVADLTGDVNGATLKLYCAENTSNLSVWSVTGTWAEGTLTWSNDDLSWGGSSLDSGSSFSSGNWYEFDVTSAVTGNGTYTFGLQTTDTTARNWASKESDNDPVLNVTTSGGGGAPVDNDPPTPDPMTFSSAPSAASASSISMTATTATDANTVQYYFECATVGGNDSGWQSSASYTDTGLSELTQYTYRVKARDESANLNETAWSATASATTTDATAPSPDPMTWDSEPSATGGSSIAMVATVAIDGSGVEYYFDATDGGTDSGWQDSRTYEDTGLAEGTSYSYRVQARDKSAAANATGYSATVSATTDDFTAPSPDPAMWSSVPAAASSSSVTMTAVTATDPCGVQYYFDATDGGTDSGWQSSATYTDTGLSELTAYSYRVKARDESSNNNETGYSLTESATTLDGTAPNPDPMTWSSVPNATGETTITMTATTATDTSGVEYSFDATDGGNDSGWQDSASYTDTGLTVDTTYTYKVQARDKSAAQNATSWSTTASDTTDDTTAPSPSPMTWSSVPTATGETTITMTATTATDGSGVEYSFDATDGGNDSGWQDSASYTDTGLTADTTYTYKVQARDKSVAQNATSWSTTASDTTDASASGQHLEFGPSDDTYIKENNTGGNWGTSTLLRVKAASGGDQYSYLKFTVSGASGTVTLANLKLYCAENTSNLSAWSVTGSWAEGTLTWSNDDLSWGGSALDTKSSMSSGTWYEFDVSGSVTDNGTYSFGLKTTDTSPRDWASKESANDPVLIVETNGGI